MLLRETEEETEESRDPPRDPAVDYTRYPRSVYTIMASEAGERFSFYGLKVRV
jgi:dipeptide/tripeptide permease